MYSLRWVVDSTVDGKPSDSIKQHRTAKVVLCCFIGEILLFETESGVGCG